MSRRLTFSLLMCVFAAIAISAQTKVVCHGKTLRIDKRKSILRSSNECKTCKNYILNDKAVDFVKPAYPDEARRQRISGSVSVQIIVNEQGEVDSDIMAAGPLLLQPIAIEAVRRTHFKKLFLDCKPAKYSGIFIVNFGPL